MRSLMKATAFLGVLALSLIPMMAQGATLTFNLGVEFSGATPPAGSPPWLTAVFDDSFGDTNTVRLTMTATNLVDDEFVGNWSFNFSPVLDPTNLSFVPIDNADSVPLIDTGVNAFQSDGDGLFDIEFNFPPPPGDFGDKFTSGENVIYDITHSSAEIDALSFDFFSHFGGGQGIYKSAAQVQSIGPTGESGWIAATKGSGTAPIPEPTTIFLMSCGLLSILGIGIKQHRKKK